MRIPLSSPTGKYVIHSDHPFFTRNGTALRASRTVPRPRCESEGPEYTHRHSRGLARSSPSDELPEGHRFILSPTQVNKERNCTCWCSPASPADSQREAGVLPHTVPGGWSPCLGSYENPDGAPPRNTVSARLALKHLLEGSYLRLQ